MTLKQIIREHILKTLQECNFNVDKASLVLELPRATLYRKLKSYGVKRNIEGINNG